MECPVTDTARLEKLLKLFFGFERAEIGNFRKAVEQFKADLPAVLMRVATVGVETVRIVEAMKAALR